MLATEITDIDIGACKLPGSELDPPKASIAEQIASIPEEKCRSIDKSLMLTDKSGKTTFTLFNNRFLSLQNESKRDMSAETVIDLAYLDDAPSEYKQQSRGMFVLALLCLSCAIFSYWFMSVPFLYSATAFVLAVVFMVFGVESVKRTVQFHTMVGAIPVLEFALDNSSHADNFIRDVKQGIANAKQSLPSGKNLNPALVAEMRRLSQAGLISTEQYDTLKMEIFSGRRIQREVSPRNF